MAEINHEFDKAAAVAIPAHRVLRMEELYGNEGWQWVLARLQAREQELIGAACDLKLTEDANRAARLRLDEIRRIIAMPRIELETASKDLKQKTETSPTTPIL
jgi:hypothetical protein